MQAIDSLAYSVAPAKHSPERSTSEPSMLVTIPEVTRLLRVCRSTVYKLLNERAITAVKIGGSTRVVRASLDLFVQQVAL